MSGIGGYQHFQEKSVKVSGMFTVMSLVSDNDCVIYHYFESGPEYRKNLLHFLRFGYRTDLDFHFVVAGPSTVDIPRADNITVTHIENRNFDFGGYAFAIGNTVDVESYDHFIFLNSSVRGPFLPAYAASWTAPFLSEFNDDVGIVGSTINILNPEYEYSLRYQAQFGGRPPFSHVQTMCFVLRRAVLKKLIGEGFFEIEGSLSKTEIILNAELHLSRRVIDYGLNLKCLISKYNCIDYREPHRDINPTSLNGDVVFPGALFGRTLHPFEAIFIKTNRGLYSEEYLDSLAGNCFGA